MSKTDLSIQFYESIIDDIVTEAVIQVENKNSEDVENITVSEEKCKCRAESQEKAKEQEEQTEIRSK